MNRQRKWSLSIWTRQACSRSTYIIPWPPLLQDQKQVVASSFAATGPARHGRDDRLQLEDQILAWQTAQLHTYTQTTITPTWWSEKKQPLIVTLPASIGACKNNKSYSHTHNIIQFESLIKDRGFVTFILFKFREECSHNSTLVFVLLRYEGAVLVTSRAWKVGIVKDSRYRIRKDIDYVSKYNAHTQCQRNSPPMLQSTVIPSWNYAPQLPGKVTPTSSPIVNATRKWKSTKKHCHLKCAKHHGNASHPNRFKLWKTGTKRYISISKHHVNAWFMYVWVKYLLWYKNKTHLTLMFKVFKVHLRNVIFWFKKQCEHMIQICIGNKSMGFWFTSQLNVSATNYSHLVLPQPTSLL